MPGTVELAARPSVSRHTLVALILAAGAAVLLLPGGFRVLDEREQLVLGALAVTLLTASALALITALPDAARGVSRWRIGPWYLLWSGITFGVAPLTWLLPQSGSATRIVLPSVVAALLLAGAALVPWTAGYWFGVPAPARRFATRGLALLLRGTTTELRGGAMPWALYAVGTGARLVTVALTGRFGYVGDPSVAVEHAGPLNHALRLLSMFALFAIAAAAYRAFSDTTRGSRSTLWTLVAIEAVVGALAGGKQYFLLSILAVLVPYGALRGRISWRILAAGAVVFLFVAVPFNNEYRQVVRGEQSTLTPAAAVAAAPGTLASVIGQESSGEVLLDSSTQMLFRLRMLDSVAITMQLTPETIPYRSPTELASAPLVGVVPRMLWPDKPILTTGYEFSQEYYGTQGLYTSVGITPLGDLYRHGGLATVAVGMVLFGMGGRLFDTLFHPEQDPRAVCFLLAFFPMLLRADIYSMIVGVPSAIVVAVVGARLICRGAVSPEDAR